MILLEFPKLIREERMVGAVSVVSIVSCSEEVHNLHEYDEMREMEERCGMSRFGSVGDVTSECADLL